MQSIFKLLSVALVASIVLYALASCKGATATAQVAADEHGMHDHDHESQVLLSLTGDTLQKLELSNEEWRARLDKDAYDILREHGTERPGTSELLQVKEEGVFVCAACQLPLFTSDSKYESGTGWPSFYEPYSEGHIIEYSDNSYGMVRTEVRCARCDGHQGHVFPDGPQPTGLRYCINGDALDFVASTEP